MTELNKYIDARELSDKYDQRICPECGTQEWFNHLERKSFVTDQWNCQQCGNYYEKVLEYPCRDCGIRMTREKSAFKCNNTHCERDTVAFDKTAVLDRLSSPDYPERSHKPGVLMGECPLCGNKTGVNGGPDGELECQECSEFYAGQFQDAWYCYGIWLRDSDLIRVNEP